ncbi:MamI family restriction endonuclease [Shewanella aquimarina]|uniref:MamI family restriction endonuclease n=1 Tax=Shewanella aquimarina TaxID=260365 RepID=UPI002014FB27|nr:MamI family restriction endonuclease [Shewanella aquimarina]MCL2910728.1 MamI family restriction endonuclease [Shewanella aquimarina]
MPALPNPEYLKIEDNEKQILKLLDQLVLAPRVKALEWSHVTKQTPNMKIGYPGQHLASLITGVHGSRTGARGDDLEDGSEVKSCSRVDQLDSCKDCSNKVLRIEAVCPHCGSENLKRMDDSKWLFTVKTEDELKLLTEDIERVFLTIADYPNFSANDFETIRFQAFEIWNTDVRHEHFKTIMSNYYYKIFLEHIKKNPNKTPAPKNFWPYSYQFYLCNPIKVFQATVSDANTEPKVEIDLFVDPSKDRSELTAESMPTSLINMDELKILSMEENRNIIEPQLNSGTFDDLRDLTEKKTINKKKLVQLLPFINQDARALLDLRDTDKIAIAKTAYKRR